jgi:hypothetical protein
MYIVRILPPERKNSVVVSDVITRTMLTVSNGSVDVSRSDDGRCRLIVSDT